MTGVLNLRMIQEALADQAVTLVCLRQLDPVRLERGWSLSFSFSASTLNGQS